jgi:nucleoid-associated protein YgaU
MDMNTATKIRVIAILLIASAVGLFAQNLLNNEFYLKAKTLRAQSERAFETGDYDKSVVLANQAQEYLQKSDEYVAAMMLYYSANGWLNRAKDRVAFAKSIKADVNYQEEYDKAVSDVEQAKTTFDGKEYERSIEFSKDALAALENIARQPPAAAAAGEALPGTYTVRLILDRRDCFWRIAEYPFVYNNPWMWKILYEANKSVIEDPDNPDLIQPGQVLKIPSASGERREGEYDPDQTYPTYRKK